MSKNELEKLLQLLQSQPEFDKLLRLFEEKYRSYGSFGKVEILNPSKSEIDAFVGLMGRKVRVENFKMTVKATFFEQAIQQAGYPYDLHSLLEAYFQKQLITKRKFNEHREEKKRGFFECFLNQANSGSSFYKFISFIKHYNDAPFIHIMYKKNPELLKYLLKLINKLFDYLPLNKSNYLPILAYELTKDYYALSPKSDGGKMMLFALQVLNHSNSNAELIPKPNEEQIKAILLRYNILFCPDAHRKMHSLWILDGQNQEEDNYQVIPLYKIGEGSFAEVYRVFDPVLKKEMACKVLFEESLFLKKYEKEGADYYLRFKREVKFLKEKISHQNIIQINKTQLVNEPAFFTMPLADYSLEKFLALYPKLSEDMRLSIFKDILNGVAYLHDCKISHRDLAPHNILLFKNRDGVLAKVADFGLAKDYRSLSASTGLFVNGYGRAGYTAPEQIRSLKNADHLSDIYSLGALLYFLLNGKSPEERYRSTVKYQLIVLKAMEEDRSKRYQTVKELMADILLMNRRSVSDGEYSFISLKTYEYKEFPADVKKVLNCISSAEIEAPNEILEKFITPFTSIPIEIFVECVKNDTVMFPFMYIAEKNINNVMDSKEVDWDQISILIDSVYNGSRNQNLQINAIKILMTIALKINNLMAQSLLVGIIVSMDSYTDISQQVAFLIEKSFSLYHDLLISILRGIEYPLDIRDVLNDYDFSHSI
ncbi:protein kinase domain-containing protein [Paenibacillus glucanolyticus]|uniref:protein kinase domain-containing protein n=1 Tax=Paenibacillus glucanolyticus TaxID=59843 RepID=UPI0036A571F0